MRGQGVEPTGGTWPTDWVDLVSPRPKIGLSGANSMVLRKVIKMNTVHGVSIPKEFANALGLDFGDYVEVYLRDKKTIVVKPHKNPPKQITVHDV